MIVDGVKVGRKREKWKPNTVGVLRYLNNELGIGMNVEKWTEEYEQRKVVPESVRTTGKASEQSMIRQAILDACKYPSLPELYKSLPQKIDKHSFLSDIEKMKASGEIIIGTDGRIVPVGADNPKLKKLLDESKRVR